jgi:hypothetical protein
MLLRIILFAVLFSLSSPLLHAQNDKKEGEQKLKSIPFDFTDSSYILLVQIDGPTEQQIKSHPLPESRVRAWWNKQINEKKEYLEKKLKRPYQVVTTADIFAEDSKYDKKKYRYALIDSSRTITINRTPKGSVIPQSYSNDFYQFYIWDRLTNTLHPGVGVGRGNEIKAFKSAVDRIAGVK